MRKEFGLKIRRNLAMVQWLYGNNGKGKEKPRNIPWTKLNVKDFPYTLVNWPSGVPIVKPGLLNESQLVHLKDLNI